MLHDLLHASRVSWFLRAIAFVVGETFSGMQEHAQEVQQLQEELAQRSASLSGMASDNQELKAQLLDMSLHLASMREDLTQAQAASSQAAQVLPLPSPALPSLALPCPGPAC